jgi:hypothetical protein
LILYTREGCHLCHDAIAVVERVRLGHRFHLRIVDIDRELTPDDPRLQSYTNEVPVIEVNGRKAFKFRVDPDALRGVLERAAAT